MVESGSDGEGAAGGGGWSDDDDEDEEEEVVAAEMDVDGDGGDGEVELIPANPDFPAEQVWSSTCIRHSPARHPHAGRHLQPYETLSRSLNM